MSASRAAGTTGTSHLEQFIERYLVPQYTINTAYKGAVLDTVRKKRHGGTFSNGGDLQIRKISLHPGATVAG